MAEQGLGYGWGMGGAWVWVWLGSSEAQQVDWLVTSERLHVRNTGGGDRSSRNRTAPAKETGGGDRRGIHRYPHRTYLTPSPPPQSLRTINRMVNKNPRAAGRSKLARSGPRPKPSDHAAAGQTSGGGSAMFPGPLAGALDSGLGGGLGGWKWHQTTTRLDYY